LWLAATLALATTADADDTNRALAQSLFDEARKLLAAGRVEEACPKFAESQRLGPAPGTMLNLAVCYEREGKLATAWEEFLQTQAQARNDHRKDREKIASDHLSALEPRLPKLTVTVPTASLTNGLEVVVDTVPLGSASWDVAAPINPGEHIVTASAPGKKGFSLSFHIGEAERREIAVPVLLDDAVLPAASASSSAATRPVSEVPPAPENSSNSLRTAGFALGGLGIVGLGVGIAFGLRARSQWNDSQASCPNAACDADGSQLSHDAAKSARFANVGFGLGILGLGVGTALILTSPTSSPNSPSLRASLSPGGAGSISASMSW
jgi:hypothetical protein